MLYRNRKGSPRKYILRYATASSIMLPGVLRACIILGVMLILLWNIAYFTMRSYIGAVISFFALLLIIKFAIRMIANKTLCPVLFEKLDAEFALILYDGHTNEYIAARDPIGIRPLFYGRLCSRLSSGNRASAVDRPYRGDCPPAGSGKATLWHTLRSA